MEKEEKEKKVKEKQLQEQYQTYFTYKRCSPGRHCWSVLVLARIKTYIPR